MNKSETTNHITLWDQTNHLIRLKVIGFWDKRDALKHMFEVSEIKKRFAGKKINFLIDLSQATKPSAEAKEIITEKIYKDSKFGKIAAFGQSFIVRQVNTMLMRSSGISKDKLKMFATEEEALKWLKK